MTKKNAFVRLFLVLAGTGVALAAGVSSARPPLPQSDGREPAILFVLDRSGSMSTCDAGPALFGNGDCTGNTSYSRMRAMQVALKRMLDANGDDAVDAADEQLLGFKIGIAAYDAPANGADYTSTRLTATWPLGSSFQEVFCGKNGGSADCQGNLNGGSPLEGIDDLDPQGFTPTAEALQKSFDTLLAPCYNGGTDACSLSLNGTSDDPAKNCRLRSIIVLTDGQSNGLNDDPAGVAASIQSYAPTGVDVFAIGFGTGAEFGELNCIARRGDYSGNAVSTDAMRDGDTNPNTPGSAACTGPRPYTGNGGAGNAFYADDAESLAVTLSTIVSRLNPGAFTRSRPAIARGGTEVYTAYFVVNSNAIGWEGHLKKFLIGEDTDPAPTYSGLLDCVDPPDRPGSPAAPRACWDAGGKTAGENVNTTVRPTLETRAFDSRRVFTPLPESVSDHESSDFKDLKGEGVVYGAGVGLRNAGKANACDVDGSGNCVTTATKRYLVDLVPLAVAMTAGTSALPNPATGLGSLTGDNLKFAMLMRNMLRRTDSDYATISYANYVKGNQALQFTVGRPTATYSNGTNRCTVQAGCTDTSPAWKMGDIYDSKPTIVTAPVLAVDDPSFQHFMNGTNGPITSSPDTDNYSTVRSNLCRAPATAPCAVKDRASVVYVAANDGMVHAFDGKDGYELWSYIPYHAQTKLQNMRFQRLVSLNHELQVRETLFPTDQDGDGRWHTVLLGVEREGGRYFFALDITDPANPKFLWEYRKPDKMGLTTALGQWGRLPANNGNFRQRLFIPGGIQPPNIRSGSAPAAALTCASTCAVGDDNCFERCEKQCKEGDPPTAPPGQDCKTLGDACKTACQGTGYFSHPGFSPFFPATSFADKSDCEDACSDAKDTCEDGCKTIVPSGTEHVHMYSMWPHNPKDDRKDSHEPTQPGLDAGKTIPPGLKADMPGSLRMIDAEPNGTTERGYYGDNEGRMWKVCNVTDAGDFKLHLFFDPAFYFFEPPVPNGYETKNPTPSGDMVKRGPIFYPPEATVGQAGEILVAVGAGDVGNPLRDPFTTTGYRNYLWVLKDAINGSSVPLVTDGPDCAPAKAILCSPVPRPTPNGTVPSPLTLPPGPGAIELDQTLTGPPVIFNNYMLYVEYDPDQDGDADACEEDGYSKLQSWQLTVCGSQGGSPFPGEVTTPSTVEFAADQGIVSGPQVDPVSGNVYLTPSVVDPNKPVIVVKTSLGSGVTQGARSWRQIN